MLRIRDGAQLFTGFAGGLLTIGTLVLVCAAVLRSPPRGEHWIALLAASVPHLTAGLLLATWRHTLEIDRVGALTERYACLGLRRDLEHGVVRHVSVRIARPLRRREIVIVSGAGTSVLRCTSDVVAECDAALLRVAAGLAPPESLSIDDPVATFGPVQWPRLRRLAVVLVTGLVLIATSIAAPSTPWAIVIGIPIATSAWLLGFVAPRAGPPSWSSDVVRSGERIVVLSRATAIPLPCGVLFLERGRPPCVVMLSGVERWPQALVALWTVIRFAKVRGALTRDTPTYRDAVTRTRSRSSSSTRA